MGRMLLLMGIETLCFVEWSGTGRISCAAAAPFPGGAVSGQLPWLSVPVPHPRLGLAVLQHSAQLLLGSISLVNAERMKTGLNSRQSKQRVHRSWQQERLDGAP